MNICGMLQSSVLQRIIAQNVYIGKEEKAQINNFCIHLKKLEKKPSKLNLC